MPDPLISAYLPCLIKSPSVSLSLSLDAPPETEHAKPPLPTFMILLSE